MTPRNFDLFVRLIPWLLVLMLGGFNYLTQQQLREAWANTDKAIELTHQSIESLNHSTDDLESCAAALRKVR